MILGAGRAIGQCNLMPGTASVRILGIFRGRVPVILGLLDIVGGAAAGSYGAAAREQVVGGRSAADACEEVIDAGGEVSGLV